MADQQKCCGTCRWGRKDVNHWFVCTFPLPACAIDPEPMYEDEGEDCHCYQPKDDKEQP